MSLKALSIRQPWAELIISGRKAIEIRSWSTTYRGRVYLHVPRKRDEQLEAHFGYNSLPTGVYIGFFDLKAVVPFSFERWIKWKPNHLDPGNFQNGLFAWFIHNPVKFKVPVDGMGQLNLFEPAPDIIHQLEIASFG